MLTFGCRGSHFVLTTCCCNRSYGILLHAVEGETITQLLFFTNIVVYEPEYAVRCDMTMFNTYNLTTVVQDLSFSDVMFATKKNMANAVASVSKQLENVHETLAVSSFY